MAAGFCVLGPSLTGISGAIGLVTSTLGILWSVGGIVTGLLSTAFAVLSSPIVLVTGAIAGIGLAIMAVKADWDNVKAAFTDGGFVDGLKAIGSAIMKFVDGPIDAVKAKWQSSKTFCSFGGGNDANVAGVQNETQKTANVVQESEQLQQESVKQKALVQPASQDQIAQAVTVANKATSGSDGQSGGGQQTVQVQIGFKPDAGKVMNKMVTASQVENSSLKGRTPLNKRKLLQNGAAFGVS